MFNLGGDLALFLLLIRSRDRDALAHYARLCIDNIHAQIQHYQCPTLTTVSLVQGEALGGGFEMALCSDVLIAEESAMLGLPEILFNLFPGMGAYSLLARRATPRIAEELILSGKVLPAARLHEMGIVDVLAKDGEGEAAVAGLDREERAPAQRPPGRDARAPAGQPGHARGARRRSPTPGSIAPCGWKTATCA